MTLRDTSTFRGSEGLTKRLEINWKYFTTGGGVAQMKTIKRYKLLKMLDLALLLFYLGLPNQPAFNSSPTG